MRSCDHILYQALVETLIPDVLRPVPSKQPSRPCPVPSHHSALQHLLLTCQLLPVPDSRELSGSRVLRTGQGSLEQGHPRVIN